MKNWITAAVTFRGVVSCSNCKMTIEDHQLDFTCKCKTGNLDEGAVRIIFQSPPFKHIEKCPYCKTDNKTFVKAYTQTLPFPK